jgi:DNA modification methylase
LYKQFQKSIYYKVTFSRTPIPECNLSKESALQKKGFNYFEDFFSYKAQAWIGAFATEINRRRIKSKYKEILFYILSASLRYISRFSTLNTSWRGEYKPLEWAKSNFWTPYSFVETNPFLAARDRFAAYERAIDDLNRRFGNAKPQIGSVNSVLSLKRQFSILNHSSQSMHELPDKSVDLILTDPPYGSYLHYGELSGYWICWLSKFHRSFKNARIFQNGEAVPSRKKYVNCKTFMDYENILTEIFNECYRVLKNGHYLVLTFNNKEPEAWIALLRSVKRAGFSLSPGGVLFQDGVEAYKRTIDLRRDGAIHGDFIYTFKKTSAKNTYQNKFSWKKYAEVILLNICNRKQPIGNSDLFLLLNSEIIPRLFISLDLSANSQDLDGFSLRGIEDLIKTYLVRENGYWVPKN